MFYHALSSLNPTANRVKTQRPLRLAMPNWGTSKADGATESGFQHMRPSLYRWMVYFVENPI